MGEASLGGLFVDSAATVAFSAAKSLPVCESVWPAKKATPRRSSSEQPNVECVPHRICEAEGPSSLTVRDGFIYIRNHSFLWTWGPIRAAAIGMDRAAEWQARCGDIHLLAPKGDSVSAELALLAASKLEITGGSGKIIVDSLVMSEGSSLLAEYAAVQVASVFKRE